MVIRQPSINITKFPHFFVSTITNLVNSLNLTYEQLLEFRIQGKQVRSENNPSEVATFDLDKKNLWTSTFSLHTCALKVVPQFNKNFDNDSKHIMKIGAMSREDFGPNWSRPPIFPSPTNYMLKSFGFSLLV